MAALPAVRSLPQPYVPVLTVLIAMVLALVCLGWLIFFVNHNSRSISINHIVDRIAGETELVIEELMPHPRGFYERSEQPTHARAARVRLRRWFRWTATAQYHGADGRRAYFP